MTDRLLFETELRLRVLAGVVRLRTAPHQPYHTAIRAGTDHATTLSPPSWMRVADGGLSLDEWKRYWDDLRLEVEKKSGDTWLPLTEEDWLHLHTLTSNTLNRDH